ncbi:MAG: hypothetical protein AAF502_19015 [Bacteroidota bacterium]
MHTTIAISNGLELVLNMKLPFILLMTFLLIHVQSYAQKLPKHTKDSLEIVLNEIGDQDQLHRWEIMYGTNIQSEIDSINRLSLEDKKRIVREHKQNNQTQIDSLWHIQNKIDLANRDKLIGIIKSHGFPSEKRVNSNTANYLLLHFLSEVDFELLNPIFLEEIKKGNMPGHLYASWFDRILYANGLPQLYGEYLKEYPCVEDLEKTNMERKKIGLKKLKENRCR